MTYKSIPSSNIVDISQSVIRSPKTFVMGGSLKTLTQLIKSIFATGEQGFAYDPNDLSTMFQDAAGTIPVTVAGQPVGLMLDKSKGLALGSELNTGAWSTGSGWTIADGIAKLALGAYGGLYHLGATTGKFYKITVKITHRAGLLQLYTNSNLIKQINSGGVQTVTCIGWSSTTGNGRLVDFYAQSGFDGEIDLNTVTIKEIKGNHAHQTQSAMRPLLVANPQRLDFDTVNDNLITILPAQLTGCTVVRSVPNVGAQILTNQTIPTPYNNNIDNCGLIVINRALTANETSQITKLFNKAAGV